MAPKSGLYEILKETLQMKNKVINRSKKSRKPESHKIKYKTHLINLKLTIKTN